MHVRSFVLATAAVLLSNVPQLGNACTRLLCNGDGEPVIAVRSMDLYMTDKAGFVVFPRGMHRVSNSTQNPVSWTSRYGSAAVTAMNMGTSDGMNEKGLSANLLYLKETVYEAPDNRPALSNNVWVQYVIDNYATVAEALDGLSKVRIDSVKLANRTWPFHLSVQDATGDSAVIEFVDGKEVIHHGRQYNVMTNEPPLDVQLANLKNYRVFGGKLPLPGDINPLSRFVRVSTFAKMLPKPTSEADAVASAIGVLRTAAVPAGSGDTSGQDAIDDVWPTLWFTAADLTKQVYYFQSMSSPNAYWVDMHKVDLQPGSPVIQVDAYDTNLSGDISATFAHGGTSKL